ncbi:EF-P lysine aminoacylase EpmA [Neptuniibacter sp. CAU 1671]|uniref:EF-P lysine aminoacylase EpmA n=1 Tax=Neptuniibacter sp. CAU 1671 TaxID=3032593 RepID=UPI0023D9EA0B|nr:EF-P lysine aminoacylase EpmA [Neptuniibacter sp. CAU 1671]MDF2181742.1 EF-P lysine aminoacylase EpmA [Neptuniibacter sp. CAU 1671]
MSSWQPSASVEMLQQRAAILARIRAFFAQRQVLEVETPVMSHCAVSDPHIDSISVNYQVAGDSAQTLYLQTSPEYAMKRLLAAGSGSIYQMGKAFRNGECGRRHNPEFTMLEWYRVGFTDTELMDEVEALVVPILGIERIERQSYVEIFQQYLNVDPTVMSADALKKLAAEYIDIDLDDPDPVTWLDLLFSHVIEPQLKTRDAVFVTDYPAAQAALARLKAGKHGQTVAARFELFVRGMELANGYHELTDAEEQALRFEADQAYRAVHGLPQRPLDMRVVDALENGLPDCSGVALGVDRLVLLALGAETLPEVLSFDFNRA